MQSSALLVDADQPPEDLDLAVAQEPREDAGAVGRHLGRARSVQPVAVAAWAEVALRIERLAAQRAGRATRSEHPDGALDERPGRSGLEADAKEVGPILALVVREGGAGRLLGDVVFLLVLVGLFPRFDRRPARPRRPSRV